MLISTKTQQRIKAMTSFNYQIIFFTIFFLVCLKASGTHAEKSLKDKLQTVTEHQLRLMRNKRDSHIPSEGMQLDQLTDMKLKHI